MRRKFTRLLLLLPILAAAVVSELHAQNISPAPPPVELRIERPDIVPVPLPSERSMLAEGTENAVWMEANGSRYRLDLENNTATLVQGSGLTEVVIPATVEYKGRNFMVTAIGAVAFALKSRLLSVEFPTSGALTIIGESAFLNCSSLSSISLPDGVQIISSNAFQGCELLTEMFIPASVDSIGSDVFNGCIGMTAFSVDEANVRYSSTDGLLLSKDGTRLLQMPPGREGEMHHPCYGEHLGGKLL